MTKERLEYDNIFESLTDDPEEVARLTAESDRKTFVRKHTNETLMQLFLYGPVWDGNLVSKLERDMLFDAGIIDRWDGWQWLTKAGVQFAVTADVKHWHDQRWRKKQAGE